MTQHWRLPAILCLSVLLGAPVLHDMLVGGADPASAVPRYLAGYALAWLGVTAIARMLERFDAGNRLAEADGARRQVEDRGGVG
jgi:hypothetical protein